MSQGVELAIRVRVEDAYAMVLGPLDYAMASSRGTAPTGGSVMRVREALARALINEGHQWQERDD